MGTSSRRRNESAEGVDHDASRHRIVSPAAREDRGLNGQGGNEREDSRHRQRPSEQHRGGSRAVHPNGWVVAELHANERVQSVARPSRKREIEARPEGRGVEAGDFRQLIGQTATQGRSRKGELVEQPGQRGQGGFSAPRSKGPARVA